LMLRRRHQVKAVRRLRYTLRTSRILSADRRQARKETLTWYRQLLRFRKDIIQCSQLRGYDWDTCCSTNYRSLCRRAAHAHFRSRLSLYSTTSVSLPFLTVVMFFPLTRLLSADGTVLVTISGYLAFAAAFALDILRKWRRYRPGHARDALSWALLSTTAVLLLAAVGPAGFDISRVPDIPSRSIDAGLYAIAFACLSMTWFNLWHLLIGIVGRVRERRALAIDPYASLFALVAQCGSSLLRIDALVNAATRDAVIARLSHAAAIISGPLVATVRIPGQPDSRILKQRLFGAALVVRSYCLWVALPRSDTREQLIAEMQQLAVTLLTRELDSLPEPDEYGLITHGRHNGIRAHALTIFGAARIILAGSLPLAAVISAEALGFELTGLLGDGVKIVSILWLVVALVALIDPSSGGRISSIQGLVGAVKDLSIK
jgi:hypothetical protein